jgi:hypothetical protein
LAALGALAVILPSCQRAPSEPEPAATRPAAEPLVTPLSWDVPAAWTKLPAPKTGTTKASYRAPRVGNDKADAEVTVFFYGTGNAGDPERVWKEWFGQFENDAGGAPERATFRGAAFSGEQVEVTGAYKVGLGPTQRGGKRSPMEMIRQGYRLVGAAVKTPDRGNWFFKMTGPDETVQAAKTAFEEMVKSAR